MPAVSRYATVGTASLTVADSATVLYLRRRFLPPVGRLPTLRTHVVRAGERSDLIATIELDDPELAWVLADANPVQRPSELAVEGRAVSVPLITGVPVPP